MIFGYFGGPGAHFGGPGAHSGGPGPHFEDFWDYCDLGGRSGAKGDTHFDSKIQAVTHFRWCCVFMFFQCSLFLIFCDFACPEAPFLLPF